jgi:hypothetical protein
MTYAGKSSLAEQRRSICQQLRLQREVVALQLVPDAEARGGFPRSMTMRLLIQRPELAVRLVTLLAGPRFAGEVSASLDFVNGMAGRRARRPAPPLPL